MIQHPIYYSEICIIQGSPKNNYISIDNTFDYQGVDYLFAIWGKIGLYFMIYLLFIVYVCIN
jgi:uncharacterized membrane protein